MTKKTHLAREMSARHIQMIALGGVILVTRFIRLGHWEPLLLICLAP